jgi:serine/threonine-protein kinase HipA
MLSAKAEKKIKIYKKENFAGWLERTKTGSQFTFDKSYLKNIIADDLSFQIKKTDSPIVTDGTNLHSFFAGLLPEGFRLRSLITNIKTSKDDLFSLFVAASENVIGDVYTQSKSPKKVPKSLPKLNEVNFYDYFLDLNRTNSYQKGEDAFAGVQEKISASMLSIPIRTADKNRKYILKLNPNDKPNLVQNEFFVMQLAKKCKLKSANVKLVKDANFNYGLLVERFDHTWNLSLNKFTMLHQEDLCQIMNLYPADKYRVSINEIANHIIKHASSEKLSILNLIKQVAFSYLIGNGDLHAKNISLYKDQNGFVDVTPAYDLITTYIYGDHKLALKIDGKDDNITRKILINFGTRFGINQKSIENLLDQLIKNFSKNCGLIHQVPMTAKSWNHLEKVFLKRLKDLS